MSCCGKKLVQKGLNIAKGTAANALGIKYEFTDGRVRCCHRCEMQTWMTWAEFWAWVDADGGRLKFAAEIDRLTEWPLLPKQKYKKGTELFCRECKCHIPKKARVKGELCPLDRWPDRAGVMKTENV